MTDLLRFMEEANRAVAKAEERVRAEFVETIHHWDDRLCDIISGQDCYAPASPETAEYILRIIEEMREVAPWRKPGE